MTEAPVDLIAEEPGPGLPSDFHQLEEEGLVVSHPGAKSLMCLSVQRIEALQKELLVADARRTVAAWRQMGISYEQAQQLLRQAWEEENT